MFFELIRIAIGRQERLRSTPTAEEWEVAYDLAQRQTLTGIAFCGVQRLPEEQRPPRMLLMKWYMAAEQIRKKNEKMDRMTVAVAKKFAENGFPGLVLKGQGIAQLYRVEQIENSKLKIDNGHPEGDARENENENDNQGTGKFSIFNSQFSISNYRTPGDIDIWLHGERKDILDYVRRHVPDCKPVYHHVDFPVIDELPIEVHFTPSWMNSPFTNRRLQDFFKRARFVPTSKSQTRLNFYSECSRSSTTKLLTDDRQRLNVDDNVLGLAERSALTTTEALALQRSVASSLDYHPDGDSKLYTRNTKQNQPLAELENQQSMTAINQRPGGAINRAEHFNRSGASLTGTEGAYSRSGASLTGTAGAYSTQDFSHADLADLTKGSYLSTDDTKSHEDACCACVGLPDGNCPPRLGGRAEERSDRAEGVYSKQKQLYENVNEDENQQSTTAINQRPGGAINRAEHFNRSAASLTGTEGAYSRSAASLTGTEGASMLPTPTLAFNRVYILVHIYRHLFHEGIGLRQLLDYYFVLQQGFTEEERTETMRTLRSLRMQRFTEAVMWVLQEVFAMDERYLLTKPNEEEGRFLLSEIMMAGNFGHYDERIKRSEKVTEWDLFRRRVGRNMRFVRSYPSEVLWAPLFKLWHAGFRFVNRNR